MGTSTNTKMIEEELCEILGTSGAEATLTTPDPRAYFAQYILVGFSLGAAVTSVAIFAAFAVVPVFKFLLFLSFVLLGGGVILAVTLVLATAPVLLSYAVCLKMGWYSGHMDGDVRTAY